MSTPTLTNIPAGAEARAAKDWSRADALRDRLAGAGVVVADGRDGATWSLS